MGTHHKLLCMTVAFMGLTNLASARSSKNSDGPIQYSAGVGYSGRDTFRGPKGEPQHLNYFGDSRSGPVLTATVSGAHSFGREKQISGSVSGMTSAHFGGIEESVRLRTPIADRPILLGIDFKQNAGYSKYATQMKSGSISVLTPTIGNPESGELLVGLSGKSTRLTKGNGKSGDQKGSHRVSAVTIGPHVSYQKNQVVDLSAYAELPFFVRDEQDQRAPGVQFTDVSRKILPRGGSVGATAWVSIPTDHVRISNLQIKGQIEKTQVRSPDQIAPSERNGYYSGTISIQVGI